MTTDTTRSHWSRPAALRVWRALASEGGSATTRTLSRLTDSMAVHSDIHGLRCLLCADYGYDRDDALDAVSRTERTRPDSRRREVTYHLRADVQALPLPRSAAGGDPAGYPHSADPPAGRASTGAPARQAALFDTRPDAAQIRRRT